MINSPRSPFSAGEGVTPFLTPFPGHVKEESGLLAFPWGLLSLGERKLVDREQGHYAPKPSARLFRILDWGMRIEEAKQKNPQSAIHNPQFGGGPTGSPARAGGEGQG